MIGDGDPRDTAPPKESPDEIPWEEPDEELTYAIELGIWCNRLNRKKSDNEA